MSARPLVSCFVASHNFARFLPRALESAFAQDYDGPLEVVVVDDGSTDDTPEAVRPFLDRIRYVRKPNGGLIETVNVGLAVCRGAFVSLLSGDDTWPPDRLRRQVEVLEARPEVGLVYGDMELVDEHDRSLEPSYFALHGIEPARGRILTQLLNRNIVSGGAMTFRASLLPTFHPLPADLGAEDWWIATRIARAAEVEFVAGSVYRYRQHGGNMNLGVAGERRAPVVRSEIAFRRLLLEELQPGDARTADVLEAQCELSRQVALGSSLLSTSPAEVAPADERQRAVARACADRAEAAFRTGDVDRAALELARAHAADPALPDLSGLLKAMLADRQRRQSPRSRAAVLDARRFVSLAWAAETLARPELVAEYSRFFGPEDDATLVVAGLPADVAALADSLAAGSLPAADSADILALPLPPTASAEALAGAADALLTYGPVPAELAALPLFGPGELRGLRALADRCAGQDLD